MPDLFDELERFFERNIMGPHEERFKRVEKMMEEQNRELSRRGEELDQMDLKDPFGQ
ncbi:hypothetical protein [Bacillus sp. CGMCC 1.16541]|uniref:hypothetical protein n=1 Tax=Bacillus sp. CGMCC 1.16541 TaxID=2185143 RepID=UPI00194FBA3A|nr:hypothetical protein [Bacillus sp. CGMCC 1.16541]